MLFTKSKTYIYIYIAGLKRISQVSSLFVCVFHIVPYRHRIKRISGNCVLPVFSPTSDQNQIYKKSGWWIFFLQNSASAFCLIFQRLYIRLQAQLLWPDFVFFVRPEFFLFYEMLLPFQSMSNPADILYKKGKRIISVLWGIKKRSNRFCFGPKA